MLSGRCILLIISGGIAAYKSLDLIRRLRERGARVRCIMTRGGEEFVTPMSVAALSGEPVFDRLFSLKDETEMGHIRLAREADLILVAPASADILAKMAQGLANDLATTTLLACEGPVMVAPAMNASMWKHPATVANMALLEERGVIRVGPNEGDLACGETGPGRMAEVAQITEAVAAHFATPGPLSGKRALVTSGPTHEPIDPVRYIANRSSGKQGHAIANALAALGAEVTLVSGPVALADPKGVAVVKVETAAEMATACTAALPVDIAVCAAAVADWSVEGASRQKIKKGGEPPRLSLSANPDILAALGKPGKDRPALVIGFAAETENLIENAKAKRTAKGCDWIAANDVSNGFGGEENTIHLIKADGVEDWERASKDEVARRLAKSIGEFFS